MKTPALLVVTPTLGESPWLSRTVESVAHYAGANTRHILVAPESRADELHARFPHCIIVADRVRRGVYPAINQGIAAALAESWEYFTWLNDDDAFAPGFSRHLARALLCDPEENIWFYGGVRLRGPSDENLGHLPIARFTNDIVPLAEAGINPLNQQGMLVPRPALMQLGNIREDLRICGDVDFWLRGLRDGARFRLTGATVAEFRLRKGQISGDVEAHRREFARAVAGVFAGRSGPLRRALARTRFRAGNAFVYLERIRRCGWRGGFDMLADPAPES